MLLVLLTVTLIC